MRISVPTKSLCLCSSIISLALILYFSCISFADNNFIPQKIDGLFGLHWGDREDQFRELFKEKLRKPTKNEIEDESGVFSTGKMLNELSFVVENAMKYNLNFKLYIYTTAGVRNVGRLNRVVAICDGASYEDYNNILNIFNELYGKILSKRDTSSLCWVGIEKRKYVSWRVELTHISLSYSICGDRSRVQISAISGDL